MSVNSYSSQIEKIEATNRQGQDENNAKAIHTVRSFYFAFDILERDKSFEIAGTSINKADIDRFGVRKGMDHHSDGINRLCTFLSSAFEISQMPDESLQAWAVPAKAAATLICNEMKVGNFSYQALLTEALSSLKQTHSFTSVASKPKKTMRSQHESLNMTPLSVDNVKATFPARLPLTPRNIQKVEAALVGLWNERQTERSLPISTDRSGSCKFACLLVREVFGGRLAGNDFHMFNMINGRKFDLNEGQIDVLDLGGMAYIKSMKSITHSDYRASLGTCMPRVNRWVDVVMDNAREVDNDSDMSM